MIGASHSNVALVACVALLNAAPQVNNNQKFVDEEGRESHFFDLKHWATLDGAGQLAMYKQHEEDCMVRLPLHLCRCPIAAAFLFVHACAARPFGALTCPRMPPRRRTRRCV